MKTLFLKVILLSFLASLSLWSAPLYSGNNFWAKLDMDHDAAGIFYAMHRDGNNSYYFYTFDGKIWNALTTLSNTDVGLYSIGDQTDMAISPNGTLHVVFNGCTNQYISSCAAYHMSYNGSWSSKILISHSARKQLQFKLDSLSAYHVSFVYSSSGMDTLYYKYSTDGVLWQPQIPVIQSSTAGDDEIVKHWLSIRASDVAEIYYVKEESQNDYEGNFYSKSISDNFSNATTHIDAISQAKDIHFNDVYCDSLDRVHFNYTEVDISATESYMYHQQDAIATKLGSDSLFERGQYRYINETLYMLVLQSTMDFSSKNLYIAKKRDGGSWSLGKPLGVTDLSANEIVFDVSDSGKVMILYEDSKIDAVNILISGANTAFLPTIYFLLLN